MRGTGNCNNCTGIHRRDSLGNLLGNLLLKPLDKPLPID